MNYDPQKHRRRSIRLRGYDYTQPGGYFVTIVTQNRERLFGEVVNGKMVLNTFGQIIDYQWQRLPQHFGHIRLDAYQIMPDHFHGIIIITKKAGSEQGNDARDTGDGDGSGTTRNRQAQRRIQPHPDTRLNGTAPGSLGAIMQNFQSVTTRKINRIRKTPGQKLWLRNYWEHIIRDENDLNRIRKYIINNPLHWHLKQTPYRRRPRRDN